MQMASGKAITIRGRIVRLLWIVVRILWFVIATILTRRISVRKLAGLVPSFAKLRRASPRVSGGHECPKS